MKTLDLYTRYSGTLSNLAASTVKPGLEAEAQIALGQIRRGHQHEPEDWPEVSVPDRRLNSLRNATGNWSSKRPGTLTKITVGTGWGLFVDAVLGVL
jgi:hypothetical protein